MSGIAGYFQTEFDVERNHTLYAIYESKLTNMQDSLITNCHENSIIYMKHHIGFTASNFSVAHRDSLSVTYKNRTASIVFTGNIYNSNELKYKLSSYDISAYELCNEELILYLYLVFGEDIFKEINGGFSFAIYENNSLIIVRDPIGIKPLFYHCTNNHFIFASQQKSIFAYGIKPELTNESWCEIIGLGPARTPGKSLFKNIFEVLPGNYIKVTFNSQGIISYQTHCYWELTYNHHADPYLDTVDKVNYLIKDSIKKQLTKDTTICSLLSGGIDSSLVTSIAKSMMDKENRELKTYAFEFEGNENFFNGNSFQNSLDRPYVETMRKYLNSNHKYLTCDSLGQIKYLKKTVDMRDAPCMADIESSLMYFCNEISETNNIALTGECADEVFGGYPWFHRDEMLNSNSFPWSKDLSVRTSLFNDSFIQSLNLKEYVDDAYKTSLSKCPESDCSNEKDKRRFEIGYLTINWFMMTLVNRMERCSVFSGLDARVPFADYRLVSYVFSIPWEYKCKDGSIKHLLKECGKDFLPPEIINRKKSPYPKTYNPEYEKMIGKLLLEEFDNNYALNFIVDKSKVIDYINSSKDYGKPWYGQLMAGPQMLAYILQISYWLKKYS